MAHTSNRQLAYVALDDAREREAVILILTRAGWNTIATPSGFHVLHAIADVIEGASAREPELIVIDAFARGCAGTTIARGLRELGIATRIVVVAPRMHEIELGSDPRTHVVAAGSTARTVAALVAPLRRQRAALIGGDRKEVPNHELSESVHEWSTRRVPPQLGSDASDG